MLHHERLVLVALARLRPVFAVGVCVVAGERVATLAASGKTRVADDTCQLRKRACLNSEVHTLGEGDRLYRTQP